MSRPRTGTVAPDGKGGWKARITLDDGSRPWIDIPESQGHTKAWAQGRATEYTEEYAFDAVVLGRRAKRKVRRGRRLPTCSGVYFIRAGEGLVKIGRARCIRRRVMNLQMASPVPLTLLAHIEGDGSEEKILHRAFACLRRHGEWFEPDSTLLSLIYSFAAGRKTL